MSGDTDALLKARALHRAGSFAEAEAIYREILERHPGRADALQLLGALCQQTGRIQEALDCARRLVALAPLNAAYYVTLGAILKAQGGFDEARGYFLRAIDLRPELAEAHVHLGDIHATAGQWAEAGARYHEATIRRPEWAEAHHRFGIASAKLGKMDQAIASYRRAVAIDPGRGQAWNDLGLRLADTGDYVAAVEAFRRAVAVRPGDAGAHNNLGVALRELPRPAEAAAEFRKVVGLTPSEPRPYLNLASALRDIGDLDGAADAARHALSLQPDWEHAKFSLAHTLLLKGDFAGGWLDCEKWFQQRVVRPEYPADSVWNGEDPSGLRILLHSDHGFGDTVQFARYAPLVAARGARVWVRCQRELVGLIRSIEGIERVVGNDEPAPAFDRHCPLIALPRVFGSEPHGVPATIPYIKPDDDLSVRWRARLAQEPEGLKVGLAWAGSPAFREDRFRSPHLPAMAALGQVRGVRFYSLQKGEAAREILSAPAGMAIVDWTEDLRDFSDTAALIESLDLVVSSDTAVVHVAGALGKPVWVAMHYAPGYFWMLGRGDSPWYPTMRLFRQSEPADWRPVMENISSELAALVKRRQGD